MTSPMVNTITVFAIHCDVDPPSLAAAAATPAGTPTASKVALTVNPVVSPADESAPPRAPSPNARANEPKLNSSRQNDALARYPAAPVAPEVIHACSRSGVAPDGSVNAVGLPIA